MPSDFDNYAPQPPTPPRLDHHHRGELFSVLIKMIFYYASLVVLITGLLTFAPSAANYLPFGGLDSLANTPDAAGTALQNAGQSLDFEDIQALAGNGFNTGAGSEGKKIWLTDALSVFIAMTATLLLMLPVAWTYKAIHFGHDYDHSIDETTILLPSIVIGIVTIVQYSLALAFSLAGIVAGVRFRRALNDTFDTLFIFLAIAAGLSAGVGALEITAVVTFFFNFATVILCLVGDGLQSVHDTQIKREKKEKKEKKRQREENERAAQVAMRGTPQPQQQSSTPDENATK